MIFRSEDIKTEKDREDYIRWERDLLPDYQERFEEYREKIQECHDNIVKAKEIDISIYSHFSNQKKSYIKSVEKCDWCKFHHWEIEGDDGYVESDIHYCTYPKVGYFHYDDPVVSPEKISSKCPLDKTEGGQAIVSKYIDNCSKCILQKGDMCFHQKMQEKVLSNLINKMSKDDILENLDSFKDSSLFIENYPNELRLLDTRRVPDFCPWEDYKEEKR